MEVKDRELTKAEREVLIEALKDSDTLLSNDTIIKAQYSHLTKIANDIESHEINTVRDVYFSTAQIVKILTAYNKRQARHLKEWEYTDDSLKQSTREKLYCSKILLDCFESLRYSFSATL